MENNELKRYTFSGYYFGKQNIFNLLINVQNYTKAGTGCSVELAIELTPDERLELVKMLINAVEKKEDN